MKVIKQKYFQIFSDLRRLSHMEASALRSEGPQGEEFLHFLECFSGIVKVRQDMMDFYYTLASHGEKFAPWEQWCLRLQSLQSALQGFGTHYICSRLIDNTNYELEILLTVCTALVHIGAFHCLEAVHQASRCRRALESLLAAFMTPSTPSQISSISANGSANANVNATLSVSTAGVSATGVNVNVNVSGSGSAAERRRTSGSQPGDVSAPASPASLTSPPSLTTAFVGGLTPGGGAFAPILMTAPTSLPSLLLWLRRLVLHTLGLVTFLGVDILREECPLLQWVQTHLAKVQDGSSVHVMIKAQSAYSLQGYRMPVQASDSDRVDNRPVGLKSFPLVVNIPHPLPVAEVPNLVALIGENEPLLSQSGLVHFTEKRVNTNMQITYFVAQISASAFLILYCRNKKKKQDRVVADFLNVMVPALRLTKAFSK